MKQIVFIMALAVISTAALAQWEQTGFSEDFDDPVDLMFWSPNTDTLADGRQIFIVTQEDSALRVDMKQREFHNGQMYDFSNKDMFFNLTDHPYAKLKIMVEPGALYKGNPASNVIFGVSPFSVDTAGNQIRQHSPPTFNVPPDSQWHEYLYDWSKADPNPADYPFDYTHITRLLIETVKWPDTYEAVFWIDDFQLGDQVEMTGVETAGILPDRCTLSANYPNPFNAYTVLPYTLNRPGKVTIQLLDMQGRILETVVNGHQDAGEHRVSVNLDGHPSGLYFYRMQAGSFRAARSMILLK
jgi:hypothetical protein